MLCWISGDISKGATWAPYCLHKAAWRWAVLDQIGDGTNCLKKIRSERVEWRNAKVYDFVKDGSLTVWSDAELGKWLWNKAKECTAVENFVLWQTQ